MKGTLHEGYFIWRVLYMKGTLYEGYFTWRVLYMKGTLHEGYFIWKVLYMKGTLHEGYFTWRVLYMKGTLYEGYFTWRVLYMKTSMSFGSYLSQFFLEWEMFRKNFREKIKTHILCSATFFRKCYGLWYNMEKYCRAWLADDNMAHGHCMLNT